jgi:hypothetical protein
MNTAPDAQASTPPAAIPRRRRWLRRLALGSAITVVVLLCAHLIWYAVASADLAQARAESAAAGLTEDPAKVVPPPCADADNAALRYQRAFGLLTLGGEPYVPRKSAGKLDPRLEPLLDINPSSTIDAQGHQEVVVTGRRVTILANASANDGTEALALLDHEDFRRVWTLVAEGARLPRCRFDHDYSSGPMILTHLSLVRNLCKLGSLRARLLAAQGRATEAVDQFADLLWLVRQFREEPTLLSTLIGHSAETQVLNNLRLALEATDVAAVDVQPIRLALEDRQHPTTWNRAIQGEFMLGCWMFRNIHDLPEIRFGKHWLFHPFYTSWLGAPLRTNDEAGYHRRMTRSYLRPWDQVDDLAVIPHLESSLTPVGAVYQVLDMGTERAAAAQLALFAAGGGTPVATSTLAVERGADGSWTISHLPKPGRSDRDQKMLLPWRIPARH